MEGPQKKAWLLGIGLDNSDEEVRITKGDNFRLIGGSDETHSVMQEQCIKLNEKLDERGKDLADLERQEFCDLADEVGMNVTLPTRAPRR